MADNLDGLPRLDKAMLKPAAAMLARAFQDYPVSRYFIADDAERVKEQPGIFLSLLKSGLKQGEVWATSPRMEGAAVWFFSYGKKETFWDYIVSGHILMNLFLERQTLLRQAAFAEYAGQVRARCVPPQHWYLQILGVDPVYQGRGWAGRLLRPALSRADRDGLPCFLETQLEKNVALYEHYGFHVAEKGTIPDSDLTSWAMVRDPLAITKERRD